MNEAKNTKTKQNFAKIEVVFSLFDKFSKKLLFSDFFAKFTYYFAKFSVIISKSIGTYGIQCLI